jgi:hypothetical protein
VTDRPFLDDLGLIAQREAIDWSTFLPLELNIGDGNGGMAVEHGVGLVDDDRAPGADVAQRLDDEAPVAHSVPAGVTRIA